MKWSGWRWLTITASRSVGSVAPKIRWNDPWPEVEEDVRLALAHEVAGAGCPFAVGVGGAGPEHRQPHAVAPIIGGA